MSSYIDGNQIIIKSNPNINANLAAESHSERIQALIKAIQKTDDSDDDMRYHLLDLLQDMMPENGELSKCFLKKD